MNVTVRIPDDFAERLAREGVDLGRQALEALVLENFRAGRMTTDELGELLGLNSLDQIDAFLKARGVYESLSEDEVLGEAAGLARLGF
jgi:hypothetical protein